MKITEMTDDQLRDWIEACYKMEKSVGFVKARRAWRLSGLESDAELSRRRNE